MEADDGAAVERARSGDGDAFRLLVERHSRNVFRLAFRMTGNEHDAEDVVQETFLRAYRQLDKYETRASFGTWLFRIASNYSLDLLRSRKRREDKRERGMAEQTDILEGMPSLNPGPDRVAFSGQVQGHVQAALGELSDQERMAFVLRHFEGMSIVEIGNVLGTNTNATKHSIFRAVQKLRRSLEPLVSAAR
jgi:RNA polymerase sigma-70 factor (ECF subfamily)